LKKIYTASSWKNEVFVVTFARMLRSWGHEVYCFAEHGECQVEFNWKDIIDPRDDGITALDYDVSKRAFAIDKKHLDWCDTCILINPAGRDSHLEAGYCKGQGKLLLIIGDFPAGEFQNMYHLADGLFRIESLGFNALREALNVRT